MLYCRIIFAAFLAIVLMLGYASAGNQRPGGQGGSGGPQMQQRNFQGSQGGQSGLGGRNSPGPQPGSQNRRMRK